MADADTLDARRRQLYARLDQASSAPLWTVMAGLVTPQPRPRSVAARWEYQRMRTLLLEAGELITAKEAERRVLVLENPGLRGMSQITQSLYAGLQMILPGEVAPSHRHAAAALRFVLEGEGGYTAVDGERITMRPGDFILTPSWTFHDHGNHGAAPVIWLDGLDVPMVNLFDASFAESWPDGDTQRLARPEGAARARYGSNLMPLAHQPDGAASPLFHYPYADAKAALDSLAASEPADPWHGTKLRYNNPASGGAPLPTMGACLQRLAAGFAGRRYRSTDATVFCVKEGAGHSVIGNEHIAWGAGDVFVVPSWAFVAHHADADAVLFSFSDRPAQQALGLWREERPNV